MRPFILAVIVLSAVAGPSTGWSEEVPGTTASLDDSTVLARVDDRTITVQHFISSYFSVDPQSSPGRDSLGRVQFLNLLVDKEVLGLTAEAIDRPMTFEDRHQMRTEENALLARVLVNHAVTDKAVVSDDEIKPYEHQFNYELKLREIEFKDPVVAERVRLDLLGGRISWSEAVKHYAITDLGPDGDIGWKKRWELNGPLALEVFDLRVGGISSVTTDRNRYFLIQVVDRRNTSLPPEHVMKQILRRDLSHAKQIPLFTALYDSIRVREHAVYDSTNIRWAVARFKEMMPKDPTTPLSLGLLIPHFDPADTSRVLLRTSDRTYTLGDFVSNILEIPPILRPQVHTVSLFLSNLDRIVFHPYMVAEARRRGLEKDPFVVRSLQRQREDLLVQHLYDDSVLTRVSVTPDERRAFYEAHKDSFMSRPLARFVRVTRSTEEGADSALAALRAGAKPESLVAVNTDLGKIVDLPKDRANPYRHIVFEDLRPGQGTVLGPDRNNNFMAIFLLSREDPRPMSYDEVTSIVDESVYNIKAEKELKAFLARLRPKHRIETHPEWVMRFDLIEPTTNMY